MNRAASKEEYRRIRAKTRTLVQVIIIESKKVFWLLFRIFIVTNIVFIVVFVVVVVVVVVVVFLSWGRGRPYQSFELICDDNSRIKEM